MGCLIAKGGAPLRCQCTYWPEPIPHAFLLLLNIIRKGIKRSTAWMPFREPGLWKAREGMVREWASSFHGDLEEDRGPGNTLHIKPIGYL